MKRLISIALVLALVALMPAFVLAKPDHAAQSKTNAHAVLNMKLPIYAVDDESSDNVETDEPIKGHITVTTPRGINSLIIRGVISELDDQTEYDVWVRKLNGYSGPYLARNLSLKYYKIVEFTTNTNGHGNFQLKIADKYLPAGTYELQIAINHGSDTVAATDKWLEIKID